MMAQGLLTDTYELAMLEVYRAYRMNEADAFEHFVHVHKQPVTLLIDTYNTEHLPSLAQPRAHAAALDAGGAPCPAS